MENKVLIQTLNILISNLDIKSLIMSNNLKCLIGVINEILKSYNINSQTFINELISFSRCMICKENTSKIILNCNHHFCKGCLIKQITKETNGLIVLNKYEDHLIPKCIKCNSQINNINYLYLFKDDVKRLTKDCKQRENQNRLKITGKKNYKTCKLCKKDRKIDDFLYECMHCCIFCSSKSIKNGNNACQICHSYDWKPNALDKLIKSRCLVCKIPKSYIDDYLLYICKDHLHCYNCLINAWKSLKCGKCYELLYANSLIPIKNHIFSKCSICQNILENNYFFEKTCCSRKVCKFCQTKSSTSSCANCSAAFYIYQSLSLQPTIVSLESLTIKNESI